MSNNYEIYYKELSYKVIGACFTVHSRLGPGLPEHCYKHALVLEFQGLHIPCSQESKFAVNYNDEHVGFFFTDLIIDNKIVLELKVDDKITQHHLSQLHCYLHVTKLKLGYLINFGARRLQYKRLVL